MTHGPNNPALSNFGDKDDQFRVDFDEYDDDEDTITLNGDFSSGPPTPKAHQNGYSSAREVPVGNLIDFSDSSEEERNSNLHNTTSSRTNLHNYRSRMPGVMDNARRLSSSPMTDVEQRFEGVANGYSNGTSTLLDSPLEPIRPSTSSPASPLHGGLQGFVPGHKKVPSASQLASHLFQQGRSTYSTNGSRRSSFNSDVENMSVSDAELHSEISDISSQVQKIQKQLSMFEEQHMVTDDKHVRLKQDNAVLQERLHALEEQMQQAEERWREKYNEEKQKNKELSTRLEREKTLEVESLTLKYQILEKDHGNCVHEREKLADQIEKLKLENSKLKEKNEELEFERKRLEEDFSETEKEFRKYQVESEAEMARNSDVLDEISRQNEELKRVARRPRQMSIVERASDMADELHRLREEHRELQNKNEELHAELLQAQVETGRSLLADGPSLASEMDGKDKDELLNELKQQEVCNQKLRAYIEGILIRVIEKHPDILEVKS